MKIYNPNYGIRENTGRAVAATNSAGVDTICLFSNSKPNATELLNGMAGAITAEFDVPEIGFVSKPNAAVAGKSETYDWLAERYRFAILASGD